MKVSELAELIDGKILVSGEDREVETGYAGDLLSFVMGRAPSGCAWFTVMTNINVCAVAVLADIAAVVICEGCVPEESVLDKARQQGVNVLSTNLDIFNSVIRFNAGQI